MANLSTRNAFLKRQDGRQADQLFEYEVLDPNHKPDLNGELAGGKVYRKLNKEFVMLTEAQARFYLDSGGIKPVEEKKE
jgi:hypothetical protein